jgi:hypothetical protein
MRSRSRHSATRCSSDSRFSRNKILASSAARAPADELQPLPGMIADRGRLRTPLASSARTLHVGILADCFFDIAPLRYAWSESKRRPLEPSPRPTPLRRPTQRCAEPSIQRAKR